MADYSDLFTPSSSDSGFDATLKVESGNRQFDKYGNPLTSSAGAVGAAQVMPSTGPEAAKLANEEFNPYRLALDEDYNKKLGKAYYEEQLKTFNGDEEKAHAAYNAGPGNVQKAIERAKKEGGNWKDYLPEETKQYLPKIEAAKGSSFDTAPTSNDYASLFKETESKPASSYADLFAEKPTGKPQNVLESFASHFVAGIPQAMGGFAAGEAGATIAEETIGIPLAPFTGGHSLWVAPVLGSLVGYGVGAWGTGKVERHLLPTKVNEYLDEGARQNEYSSFLGDITSFGAVGGVSTPETWKKALVLGAGGVGFEGAMQLSEGKFDPTKLALSGLTMPFLGGKPTVLGRAATLKSFRESTSLEESKDLVKEDTLTRDYDTLFVFTKVGDTPVVDVWNQTLDAYAKSHNLSDHGESTAHIEGRTNTMGPVREHEVDGVKVLEVDKHAILNDYNKNLPWDKTTTIPEKFKTPQDYVDFLIQREKARLETPYDKWKAENPSGEDIYNSRKSYYDEVAQLRTDIELHKMVDEDASHLEARLAELEKKGAPAPVIENKAKLSPEELRSVLYGSKNVGEAIDRIVAGKFGSPLAQTIFKLIQKGKFLSDAELVINDHIHPEYTGLYEHGPGTHRISLYGDSNLRTFAHEIFHAGTSKALMDPINVALKERFDKLYESLIATAEKHELYVENPDGTTSGHYGLASVDELIAEAFTNQEFQNWLKNRSVLVDNVKQSGWNHFKDFVKNILGIKDKEGISSFDQIIDLTHELTHEENKYGNWDRQASIDQFDFKEGGYNKYLDTVALEQAESNPFFNTDNLNIPDVPNDPQGLADFLYVLDHGKIVDDMRGDILYRTATKEYKITPELKDRLRVYVEGLNENHIDLNNQAAELDQKVMDLKRSINDSYKEWRKTHEEGQEPDSVFNKSIAERYKQAESFEKQAADLRQRAKEKVKLTPQEQEVFDKVYKPLLENRKEILQFLMDEGIIPKVKLEGDNFPRKLRPLTSEEQAALQTKLRERGLLEEEPGLWGKVKNYFAELAGGDMGGFNADIQRRRGASEERSLFALQRPNGKRDIIQITKSGNIIRWDKGVPTLITRKVNPDGSMVTETGAIKVGDKVLGDTVMDATMEEVEAHSPYRYNKDSLAVLINSVSELREQARVNEGIKRLTEGKMFKEQAVKAELGKALPEGYRLPTHVDKIPSLRGYAFPNKTAEIIEDFARIREPSFLTNMAGVLIKNMMLNPIPHMFNEAWHLYNARGLTGWVTPSGIARFAKYTQEATTSVLNMDQFYRDTLKLGGSLLAPGTRHSELQDALFNTGLKQFAGTPSFKELAAAVGRAPGDLYNGISKNSNRAMWITRDIMYVQYLKELMAEKGLSHLDAIKYAERHLPNYRLPSRIGEKMVGANISRGLSSVLQNPNITVFSRYHYGMVKSIMETVKDVGAIRKGKAGMEEFKDGINTAAAVAVALSVLYPLMDTLAERITQNPHAKQRRAGPYHLFHAIGEVAEGSKDPQAVLSSVFTWNPALVGLIQLGIDRNLYNGQQIYNPQSDPDVMAQDIGRYILQQVPQASQAMRAEADKSGAAEGWATVAARQLDIEAPSAYKEFQKQKRMHQLQQKTNKYDAKRRAGVQ